MALTDYSESNDCFKLDDEVGNGLSFPCCVCEFRHWTDKEEPCRSCDHNANAVRDSFD